ncbi:MAG: PIN domain-containing protein [Candidatus Omnitrophota bacterium]
MIHNSFQGIRKIFLDSAPVIYFVEQHPVYYSLLKPVFERIDNGEWKAVISPITIAECLIIPLRMGNHETTEAFIDLFGNGASVACASLQSSAAQKAAEIRARHNLTLLDSFQIAAAIENQCDVFLTNDKELRRLTAPKIITL